jgi:hypothetical protein
MEFTAKEIKESKKVALQKIKQFLEAENVDAQFNDRSGDYYSSDKFIVTWNANYKGIPSEFAIDKCDSFYASFSGYKAIYATRSLFHEKQLRGYHSIERALIEVGMKLCSKEEKKAFFEKYATKYNARLQKEREQKV